MKEKRGFSPAQEVGAVVKWVSCQAKAHIETKGLCVVVVEGPDQTRGRGHFLSAQRPRLRVSAGSGGLQSGRSLPVRHRLPLDKGGNLGGAVELREPQHLLVATQSHCRQHLQPHLRLQLISNRAIDQLID